MGLGKNVSDGTKKEGVCPLIVFVCFSLFCNFSRHYKLMVVTIRNNSYYLPTNIVFVASFLFSSFPIRSALQQTQQLCEKIRSWGK